MRTATAPKSESTKFDAYEAVTAKVIAASEKGLPWQSVYNGGGLPLSMSTNRPYRGINILLLAIAQDSGQYASRYWGTYKKIQELGGQVRKGEKSTMVTFWKRLDKEVVENGASKQRSLMMLRTYLVFNADQADWPQGLPAKFSPRQVEDPIAEAEAVIDSYRQFGPQFISSDQSMAWYSPSRDLINVPDVRNIVSRDDHYSTTFHEMVHSTGHESRLAREGIKDLAREHKGVYAFEELVAEFGAAFLSAHCGIESTLDNSGAYIAGWSKYLTNNPRAAVKAASLAQRAVDFILSTEWEEEGE